MWHIAHNADIKCMTMVGVQFSIQHLLTWLGFQVPPTLLCPIFALFLVILGVSDAPVEGLPLSLDTINNRALPRGFGLL
jgi:hypothetical protein